MGLENILATVAKSRRRTMGRQIRYRRGSREVLLQATLGQSKWDAVDDNGNLLRCQSQDYLVLAAELVINGNRIEPARGDVIEECVPGQKRTFEVLPGPNNQVFAVMDTMGVELRIHTQLKTKT